MENFLRCFPFTVEPDLKMCIVFLYQSNDDTSAYKLILAANREEYFSRPSKQADFLADAPKVVCGVDLRKGVEGGSWLGVSKSGKFAAMTNVLVNYEQGRNKLSRGKLWWTI